MLLNKHNLLKYEVRIMVTDKWCKVLIVDDELLIRQGIKHAIQWEEEGFKVVGEASNGKEALELIQSKQPHIVITDIVMPIMDGEQLAKIIKEEHKAIEIIILSSFNDFDYVRATFRHGVSDYILKPKLEGKKLLKALQHASSNIKGLTLIPHGATDENLINHQLERSVLGYEDDEISELIQKTFPHSHYSLFGIDLKRHLKQNALSAAKQKIVKMLQGEFSQVIMREVPTEGDHLVFLCNFEWHQLQTIKQFIKYISKSNKRDLLGVGWILTEPFEDFGQLKRAYQEDFMSLLHYRFYLPDMPLIIYDEAPSVRKINDPFKLAHFIAVFKKGQFDQALNYLKNHTDELIHQYSTDDFIFKSFLGNIIFNITILLGNMKYEISKLEEKKYYYISMIDEAKNAKEALILLDKFLNKVTTVTANQSVEPEQSRMKELLHYIDQNYTQPLTLTEMAKHFHYNPSYLSNYFKEHNGMGFSEYLNFVRIEKAVEKLEKTTISIAEISVQIGYSDHSYFGRVFRNLKGISPSKYRRKYLKVGKKT